LRNYGGKLDALTKNLASYLPEIDKATRSKENNMTTVRHHETIDLWLYIYHRLGISLEPGDIDFDIEVTDAATYI
jgi:hypothetical protein